MVDKHGLGILNLPSKFQVVKCRSCVIIQFSIYQDTFMHTGVLSLDKVGHVCPIVIIQHPMVLKLTSRVNAETTVEIVPL